jgi:ABC-2 type transport system ATP-binding protein
MIRVTDLSKTYAGVRALDHLSLEVPKGSVFGLLGPNGAGKTTLLKLVMGFLQPNSGRIQSQVPRWRIGYLPERAVYPPQMRVRDYLRLVATLAGLRGGMLRDEVALRLRQVELDGAARQRIGTCSRGVLQRVGLAQALLGDPPLLLLDEPASNLDPKGQRLVREVISARSHAGTTVLVSSHRLDEVTRVCSHVGILQQGQLAQTGLLADILAPRDEVVIETGPLPPAATGALAAFAADVMDGRVTLRADATAHKAAVLQLLLDEGVDIRGLSQIRASLEEVYLGMVGE